MLPNQTAANQRPVLALWRRCRSSPQTFSFFYIIGFPMFPNQTADNCVMEPKLTTNSFEGHSCRCIPIICHLCTFDNPLRAMIRYCKKMVLNNPYAPYCSMCTNWILKTKAREAWSMRQVLRCGAVQSCLKYYVICMEFTSKRLPLETKNTRRIRKWESRFYWDSS